MFDAVFCSPVRREKGKSAPGARWTTGGIGWTALVSVFVTINTIAPVWPSRPVSLGPADVQPVNKVTPAA